MTELPPLTDTDTTDRHTLRDIPLRERRGMAHALTSTGTGLTALERALAGIDARLDPTPPPPPRVGRAQVEALWLAIPTARVLHHATLTEAQVDDLDTTQYVETDPNAGMIRLTCHKTAYAVAVPGVLERLTQPRCAMCCAALNYPEGAGSPVNDDHCADTLTTRLETL